ncbi:FixH family protein [Mucilaginibacter auburnensis]|uniref:Nitrogen fixation protein FixH n=1 Tax=Mucilaginibacter auburnensis TaxID=1457233 RepID=A0A2H9VRV7_9SPHI|nr:FixH family protein [Mucilaginibacter auburnensis]PJJ83541.1 hypothetical protein CLV57_0525 [Mucilaginibacter auburnensis]
MEIKINWGKGLVIGMGIFMLFIIGLGVSIFSQKGDDYDQAYYEKGLDYNADYDRERQVVTDNAVPGISVTKENLIVGFKGQAEGVVHIQRPSDKSMDKNLSFASTPNGRVELPLNDIARGRWQLVFEWNDKGKKYLYQKEVFIP